MSEPRGEFRSIKIPGGRAWVADGVPEDWARMIFREAGEESAEKKLVRPAYDSGEVFVKIYRRRPSHGLLRRLKHGRAVKEGCGYRAFRSRGIPTVELLLYGELRRGLLIDRGFVVTRLVPARNVAAVIMEEGDGSVAMSAAVVLATIHDAGLNHGDAIIQNFLATEPPLPLDVACRARVNSASRRLELQRFLGSLAMLDGERDTAAAALRSYLELRSEFEEQAEELLDEAMAYATAKNGRNREKNRRKRRRRVAEGDGTHDTNGSWEVLDRTVDGPTGAIRMSVRSDYDSELLREVLRDPDAFVPAPTRPSHVIKAKKRRAVYSFPYEVDGVQERVYLKVWRVRSVKDFAEELLLGKRAGRSFAAGIEAERRGISVCKHLGTSAPASAERRPAGSALVTLGVPRDRTVEAVLVEELSSPESAELRSEFLRAVGTFCGDAHRRGLVHADLKLRNIFVLEVDPPRFALIDLDRARFIDPDAARPSFAQKLDRRRLMKSFKGLITEGERRSILDAYHVARRP